MFLRAIKEQNETKYTSPCLVLGLRTGKKRLARRKETLRNIIPGRKKGKVFLILSEAKGKTGSEK